jgi:hypothetical protein
MEIRKKVLEITDLAMALKDLGYDCFVEYVAHIDSLTVRLFDGKWQSEKDPVITSFYLTEEKALLKSEMVISQLKNILYQNGVGYDLEF